VRLTLSVGDLARRRDLIVVRPEVGVLLAAGGVLGVEEGIKGFVVFRGIL
jgi:hypothetical protein